MIRETDLCARLGGDEFGLILATGGTLEGAKVVAQNIARAMELPFSIEDKKFTMGCSIGIAIFPEHGEDEQSLLRNSDAAMYSAKQNGGGYILCDVVEKRVAS